MNNRYILLGESITNNHKCGVSQYSKLLIEQLKKFDLEIDKFLVKDDFGLIELVKLLKQIFKYRKYQNNIIVNMNTQSYARSLSIRFLLIILKIIKVKIILIMHEDIFRNNINIIFNFPFLFSDKIILNRKKRYYSKKTQFILKRKNFLIVNNPSIISNNIDFDFINNIFKEPQKSKHKFILAIFGILSIDKGFDKALDILDFFDDAKLYIFSDLDISNDNHKSHQNLILKKINNNKEKVELLGKIDLSKKNIIKKLAEVNFGLFLYRKNAGIWNTTLRTLYDLNVPIFAINFVDKNGWDKTNKIYSISTNKLSEIKRHLQYLRFWNKQSSAIKMRNYNDVAKEIARFI